MGAGGLRGTITVLVENDAARDDLGAEHGLSLWIETTNGNVLFDTGASGLFAENAENLGIDLSAADAVVLSHGHYDHAGGLSYALDRTSAPLYVGKDATMPKRKRGPEGLCDIGCDSTVVNDFANRDSGSGLSLVTGLQKILPGIAVLPAVPMDEAAPADNGRLLRERDGKIEQDPFDDELSLLLNGRDHVVVVTGCSHRGIANIVAAARQAYTGPASVPWQIVGGFHLSHENEDRVRSIGRALSDVAELRAGHCTGAEAFGILAEMLPGRVGPIPAGASWRF